MPDRRNSPLAFGPFRLYPAERRLERDGEPLRLGGRALDLLIFLVEHAGEIVSNRALLEGVWRDVSVEDDSLRFHVKNLRKILGDSQPDTSYVRNVPGRGYCFVVPVEEAATSDAPKSSGRSIGAKTNLPPRGSAIIGRSDSIETLSRELMKRRLITIAGPGGIGKTTLAIATAEALRGSFGDAVFFVDLAPIENPILVVSTLVSVLGVALRVDEPIAGIVDFLRDKRLLIVIDNCEQVIEAVARMTDAILRDAVGAHILITSREPLQIAGERVHRLMPLECPPVKANITAADAMGYAAVQLFVDRATASVSDFSLKETLAPAVAEICRRLDGIPLAIELAAARVEFFGVFALATGLKDMFAVLTKGRRLALPRHQTLRATLDWGHNLLSPTEQAVLRRVAIFRAAFSLESALSVVVGPEIPFENVVDAMGNLVAKSLMNVDSRGGTPQYRLLEATRLYANEKLAASNEGPETARRHAERHLWLFEDLKGDRESNLGEQWLRLYAGRIDDVRAALDWSFSQDGDLSIGLELTVASAPLWFQLSLSWEYRERVERALRRLVQEPGPDAVMEMRLQTALGHVFWYAMSEPYEMERAFMRALELAEQVGDTSVQLQGLWGMWAARRARGQYREALAVATQYEAIARTAGDQAFILLGDRILGLTHHYLGNQETARQLLEQVRSGARSAKSPPNTEFQLHPEVATATILTRILWLQGFPDRATAMLQAAIEAAKQSEHRFSMSYVLGVAGCSLSAWSGNLEETRKYLEIMAEYAADNPMADRWRQCWTLILRLRQGGERGALIASFYEPRVDVSTFEEISMLASAPTISMPMPAADDEVGDALWSLPEVLRVNAELVLWQNGPGAAEAAESKLLRSLDLARRQCTLSWELRAATSLARLWRRGDRVNEACDLLAATCDRFTEGFDTADFVAARRLISEWS
jgi:predicted ATPase/DNA-binding winged helix-turn-helix (wHTH) protein